jgi:hypothetical protein
VVKGVARTGMVNSRRGRLPMVLPVALAPGISVAYGLRSRLLFAVPVAVSLHPYGYEDERRP